MSTTDVSVTSKYNITIESLWDLKGFRPNPKQRDAILHTDGPLFLTAGPGSGKTRVLLWRTLNLIVFKDVKPDEIFLSTFTEKAANQLQEGLKSLLGLVTNLTDIPFDISKMSLGTVHSICQSLTTDRRFTPFATRRHAPVLMDELGQYFYIYNRRFWEELISLGGFPDEETANRSINQYVGGRNSSSRHNAVVNCMSLFNRFSEECLDASAIVTADTELQPLLKMYRHYLSSLNNGRIKTVDFSLLQQSAYEIISAFPDSGKVFKHVIIDEYQDTNTIQEKIFFKLAEGGKNICVVGDDDQALYRFRGATVENLVEFEDRCQKNLGLKPARINLDKNYRSRKNIVSCYTDFISRIDWSKEDGRPGFYRVADKKIHAHNQDKGIAVIKAERADKENVCEEIAKFVRKLKKTGKIEDYNQIAFLFPAMKDNTRVRGLKEALEKEGIPVYAPRAGRFLEVEEALAIYGLFIKVFGKPSGSWAGRSGGMREFSSWMKQCEGFADQLCKKDSLLNEFINDRRAELDSVLSDYEILLKIANKKRWNLDDPFELEMAREFIRPTHLSAKAKRNLTNRFFQNVIKNRLAEGNPFSLKYIINRATAVDWSILDLFYQLNGFKHFREMYELAEKGLDEGPVCNLGLITQYLARFMENYSPVISASFLAEERFARVFFSSFTYALFRLGESEYENAEDPFPKGRVPFLTIHQAKGLEFPVVVLGSLYKTDRGPSRNDLVIHDLLQKEGEPLERMAKFDIMRMFYVALSRSQNLLVLPDYKGPKAAIDSFKEMFSDNNFCPIKNFDVKTLPKAEIRDEDLGKNYSYTGDYLQYKKCPRQYMIFRKYGFVPSRSQTMFFGSLVHQTIEDLHHLLIQERKGENAL